MWFGSGLTAVQRFLSRLRRDGLLGSGRSTPEGPESVTFKIILGVSYTVVGPRPQSLFFIARVPGERKRSAPPPQTNITLFAPLTFDLLPSSDQAPISL